MFFLGTLLALAAVTALLFAVPLRMKAWAALGLTLIGTLAVGIRAAATLAGAHYGPLWVISGTPFGGDSGSMDGLSALFVLVIAIGSVAAVLYSQGYLARHLQHKSPAHVSLHYTSLVTMCYAMLGVVLSDGGYSFLFFWELMTVASFLLMATTTIEAICRALRQLHVPKLLTNLLLLTFRYVGLLLSEVAVMQQAYSLRAPGQKGIHISAWGSFLGQLLLRSMDRAQALYESMELRGFSGEFPGAVRGRGSAASWPYALVCPALMLLARYFDLSALMGGLFV